MEKKWALTLSWAGCKDLTLFMIYDNVLVLRLVQWNWPF